MRRLDFRRFSRPDVLKKIEPGHLRRFLKDVGGTYVGDDVDLDADSLDYAELSRVLSKPGPGYPDQLADALFYAQDFGNSAGAAEELWARAEQAKAAAVHHDGANMTIEDLVITLWSTPDGQQVVRAVHAEYCTANPRSFESFFPADDASERTPDLSDAALTAFEADLDTFFRNHRNRTTTEAGDARGGVRVILVQKQDASWFIIRLPAPWERRVYVARDGGDDLKQGHPEEYHVLIFHPARQELSIHAQTKTETTRYREAFGAHLFGDQHYFSQAGRVSLEPLRTQGRQCLIVADVAGIDKITLVEAEFAFNNDLRDTTIRKATDLFDSFLRFKMPPAPIRRAVFKVQFEGDETEHSVRVYAGARSSYSRESTHNVIKDWLARRGFLRLKGRAPPTALRGLWEALLHHGNDVFSGVEWDKILGDGARVVQTYLQLTGQPVPTTSCGLGSAQGCRRALVGPVENGTAVYACNHDERRCESVQVPKVDAAAYRLTVDGVVDALAAATTGEVAARRFEEDGLDLWSLGTRKFDGTGVGFWFTRSTGEDGVQAAITAIRAQRTGSEHLSVLLLTSTSELPSSLLLLATADGVHFLPLVTHGRISDGSLVVDLLDLVYAHRDIIGGCDPNEFNDGRHDLIVDPLRSRYWFMGRSLSFGAKSWGPQRSLESLACHVGKVVTFETFQGEHSDKVERTARASFPHHVKKLRDLIDESRRRSDPPIPDGLIESVDGGYRLNLSAGRVLAWSVRGQ